MFLNGSEKQEQDVCVVGGVGVVASQGGGTIKAELFYCQTSEGIQVCV